MTQECTPRSKQDRKMHLLALRTGTPNYLHHCAVCTFNRDFRPLLQDVQYRIRGILLPSQCGMSHGSSTTQLPRYRSSSNLIIIIIVIGKSTYARPVLQNFLGGETRTLGQERLDLGELLILRQTIKRDQMTPYSFRGPFGGDVGGVLFANIKNPIFLALRLTNVFPFLPCNLICL